SLPEQLFDGLRRQLAPFTWLQIARQLDRPVAHAPQRADPAADRLEHPPHLPIAALPEGHAVPPIGSATLPGRIDPREHGEPVFERDTVAQFFEVRLAKVPLDPRLVLALDFVAWVHQPV